MKKQLVNRISSILSLPEAKATKIYDAGRSLYHEKMHQRFSRLRVTERIKRTNPFLVQIRGIATVEDWAKGQAASTLIASEEEAVGHLLEAIAIISHVGARKPKFPDDFDYEIVDKKSKSAYGYQVKLSWDCMPMSSRKNLSNTIRKVKKVYKEEGFEFIGYFAPCYGKTKTTEPPGQDYVSLSSREFWTRVGNGDTNFDSKVGEVCRILCAEFRQEIKTTIVPDLIAKLSKEAKTILGDDNGNIVPEKLFRAVNR